MNPQAIIRPARIANTPRDTAQATATTLITNLLRCMLWLIRHGIYVIGFNAARRCGVDEVTVKVAASPYLQRLFADECAWLSRRQEGALTVRTWFAHRYGIRIEWEEVTCTH